MTQLPLSSRFNLRSITTAMALAIVVPLQQSQADVAPLNLRSAATFAVLASSTVTTIPTTIVGGDLGVSPGTAVTGAPSVDGAKHYGDPIAAQARADATTAYNDAAGRNVAPILVAGNLGGQTLAPGLYRSSSSLAISSGDLTLDAQGDPNAVWIFQMASTMTTTAGRRVILSGGANANNIFWQVGSSATFGTNSDFKGTILAFQALTMNTGATLQGRAIALHAAVALDRNTINLPDTAPNALFGNTVVASIVSGSGSLASSGKFQFVASTGIQPTYLLASLAGNTPAGSGSYTYEKPFGILGTLTFGGIKMTLTFSDRTNGRYTSTASGGKQSGTFVVSRTLPDVNQDGLGDLFFKGGNELLRAWEMKGPSFLREILLRNGIPATGLTVVGQGDINRDGHADLILENRSTRALVVWFMKGKDFLSSSALADGKVPPTGWNPVAIADFNADGQPDILLQTQEHAAVVWLLNGKSFASSKALRDGSNRDQSWGIVGTGDFNGDLLTDIVWQNSDGPVNVWYLDKLTYLGAGLLEKGPDKDTGWKLRGVADFNFNGKTDLLYQHTDGRTEFWFFDKATFLTKSAGRNVGNTVQKVVGPN